MYSDNRIYGLMSENREASARNLVRLLDTLGAQKYFKTKETRKIFLEQVTPDQFVKIGLLISKAINGRNSEYAQGALIQKKLPEAEGGFKVVEYQSPRIEDKKDIFVHALEAVKKIRSTSGMRHAAACLVAVINALHPFPDGNGRATRVLYWLLVHGYSGDVASKHEIERLVRNDVRSEVDTSSTSLLTYADQYLRERVRVKAADGTIESAEWYAADRPIETLRIPWPVAQMLGGFNTARLQRFFSEKEFVSYTLAVVLSKNNMLVEPYVTITSLPDGTVTTQIHTEYVVKALTVEMAEALVRLEARVKREAIETIVDVFSDPLGHTYIGPGKKSMRMDLRYIESLQR